MYSKVYRANGEVMVAACSSDLLGKKLKDGEIVLEVKESFYKGNLTTEDELVFLLKDATIANLVGKAVDVAIKNNLVDEDCVIEISGVKHAQIVLI